LLESVDKAVSLIEKERDPTLNYVLIDDRGRLSIEDHFRVYSCASIVHVTDSVHPIQYPLIDLFVFSKGVSAPTKDSIYYNYVAANAGTRAKMDQLIYGDGDAYLVIVACSRQKGIYTYRPDHLAQTRAPADDTTVDDTPKEDTPESTRSSPESIPPLLEFDLSNTDSMYVVGICAGSADITNLVHILAEYHGGPYYRLHISTPPRMITYDASKSRIFECDIAYAGGYLQYVDNLFGYAYSLSERSGGCRDTIVIEYDINKHWSPEFTESIVTTLKEYEFLVILVDRSESISSNPFVEQLDYIFRREPAEENCGLVRGKQKCESNEHVCSVPECEFTAHRTTRGSPTCRIQTYSHHFPKDSPIERCPWQTAVGVILDANAKGQLPTNSRPKETLALATDVERKSNRLSTARTVESECESDPHENEEWRKGLIGLVSEGGLSPSEIWEKIRKRHVQNDRTIVYVSSQQKNIRCTDKSGYTRWLVNFDSVRNCLLYLVSKVAKLESTGEKTGMVIAVDLFDVKDWDGLPLDFVVDCIGRCSGLTLLFVERVEAFGADLLRKMNRLLIAANSKFERTKIVDYFEKNHVRTKHRSDFSSTIGSFFHIYDLFHSTVDVDRVNARAIVDYRIRLSSFDMDHALVKVVLICDEKRNKALDLVEDIKAFRDRMRPNIFVDEHGTVASATIGLSPEVERISVPESTSPMFVCGEVYSRICKANSDEDLPCDWFLIVQDFDFEYWNDDRIRYLIQHPGRGIVVLITHSFDVIPDHCIEYVDHIFYKPNNSLRNIDHLLRTEIDSPVINSVGKQIVESEDLFAVYARAKRDTWVGFMYRVIDVSSDEETESEEESGEKNEKEETQTDSKQEQTTLDSLDYWVVEKVNGELIGCEKKK
jgi:hypothetical protein